MHAANVLWKKHEQIQWKRVPRTELIQLFWKMKHFLHTKAWIKRKYITYQYTKSCTWIINTYTECWYSSFTPPKKNINFRIPSTMVIWFYQPQPPPPPPQVAGNTDLGIMMDCESSSTRGYSSQGQFLRASVETRDQNGAGCVPRKRFTLHGDGNYDLGFFVVAIFWLGNELFGSSKLSLRLQYVLFWEIIHM